MNKVLSKSDYLLFLKHPAWAWLKKHEPKKLPPVDANLQAVFDAGHEFEAYAEQLFPGGLTLGWDPQNYGSYQTLPARTATAIQNNTPVIFQGRLESNNITAIFDILTRVDETTFDLYEIKSSTKAKDEHIDDLAFQAHLLKLSGYTVRNIGVVHLNSSYVRHGAINAPELCATTIVTEQVKERLPLTIEKIAAALAVVSQPTCPDLSPSLASKRSLKEWLSIYYSLNPGDLPPKENQPRVIDQPRVQEFLAQFQYPLYFLDYETLAKSIPPFDGTRPYQQIPFQYSLHVVPMPGAEPVHLEYLHRAATNPGEDLIGRLQEDIGDTGSVVVWYAAFEKGRNAELAVQHPEHSEWLLDLNRRVIDLMIPFKAGWIKDGDFNGSASIKKVLPVLVPELSYTGLAIAEGETAQRIWMETVLDGKHPTDGKHSAEREQIMTDLIAYCRLDTLAMVKIFDWLAAV